MTKPTEAMIVASTKEVEARDIKAYDDAPPNVPLMAQKPTPGAVVATRTISEIGVTEWTLSNGAKVVLKPTNFKEDEILFEATSAGGVSLAEDPNLVPANTADQVVPAGGLGVFGMHSAIFPFMTLIIATYYSGELVWREGKSTGARPGQVLIRRQPV